MEPAAERENEEDALDARTQELTMFSKVRARWTALPSEFTEATGLRRTKLPAPWLEYQDPGTGHSYFVNPQTGASQWARPG